MSAAHDHRKRALEANRKVADELNNAMSAIALQNEHTAQVLNRIAGELGAADYIDIADELNAEAKALRDASRF